MIEVLPPDSESTDRYNHTSVVQVKSMDCSHGHRMSSHKGKQRMKQQQQQRISGHHHHHHHRNRPPCPVHSKEEPPTVFYMNATEASHTYSMPALIPVQFLQPVTDTYYPEHGDVQDERNMLHMEAEYQNQLRERLRAHSLVDSLEISPRDSLDDGCHENSNLESSDLHSSQQNGFSNIHNAEHVTISTYQQNIVSTQNVSNSEPLQTPDNVVISNIDQDLNTDLLTNNKHSNEDVDKTINNSCNKLDNEQDTTQSTTTDDIDDNHSTLPRVASNSTVDYIEMNKQLAMGRHANHKSYGLIHVNKKEFKVKSEEETARTAEDLWQKRAHWLGQHVTRDRTPAKRSMMGSKKHDEKIVTSSFVTCDKTGEQRINVCLELKLPLQSDKNGITKLDAICTPVNESSNNRSQPNTSREHQTHVSETDKGSASDNASSSSNREVVNEDESSVCNPYKVLPPIRSADASQTRGSENEMVRDITRKTASSDGYAAQFERNRNKTDYKEYTLNDYKRIKNDFKLGGLGPDITNEVLKEKKSNVMRKIEYAKTINERNRKCIKQPKAKCIKPRFSTRRATNIEDPSSRRKSALEYAKNVPKPKVKTSANVDANDESIVSSTASTQLADSRVNSNVTSVVNSRVNSRINSHTNSRDNHHVNSRANSRVNSRVESRVDVTDNVDEIEAMQKRHERERKEAEAISSTILPDGTELD